MPLLHVRLGLRRLTSTQTEIAQKVVDLGGIHKYDLTPDATHLIVGDYDTPKYRHVARERPDIRAMDAAWIDAVSKLWMNDEPIDFLALEKEHQLKAFETRGSIPAPENDLAARHALLICLTGFGTQRDEIAQKIIAHGGRHTDDLTRRCTHLVVHKPEGKKFTAAKSWGIRTVTLDWLDQSAARGMILEEAKFDPLLPPEEQGVGAWIKKDPQRRSLGKRSRSMMHGVAQDGTRKLRKTASMKLNSQRNNIWGDILQRSNSREYSFAKEHSPEEPKQKTPGQQDVAQPAAQSEQGIFADCIFHIHGFTDQRAAILSQAIKPLDGQIASTLCEAANHTATHRFLIVPQTSLPETHPSIDHETVHIVTEFYVEKCLHHRKFFAPSDHPVLGRPFPLFPIPGFAELTICTAAFTGIELSQVVRSIAQLGARFEGQFRRTTSMLVCRSLESMRKDKLRAALAWGVPVVSADWLWECISTGYNVPVDDFIFPEVKGKLKEGMSSTGGATLEKESSTRHIQRTYSEPVPKPLKPAVSKTSTMFGVDTTAFEHDSVASGVRLKAEPRREDSAISADFQTARTQQAPTAIGPPLTELSSASLNKSPSPTKPAPTTLPRTRSDTTHNRQEDEESQRLAAKVVERQVLTSKLTTLLDTAGSAVEDETPPQQAPRPRKRQILGRATSNVSACSSASVPCPTNNNDTTGNAEEEKPPQSTQIGYHDPEAQGHKAALMDRMMGGSGDVEKTKTVRGVSADTDMIDLVPGRRLRGR